MNDTQQEKAKGDYIETGYVPPSSGRWGWCCWSIPMYFGANNVIFNPVLKSNN